MTDATEELDWHLRQHGLGRVEPGRMTFDWDSLAERRLILVPSYEHDSRPVYDAVKRQRPDAEFFLFGQPVAPIPNPNEIDFDLEIEIAISSIATPAGDLCYVSFYTEEAYLAVTPETAEAVFCENAFDLLGRAFARCVADDSLRMRRHRHGVRIFLDALHHLDRLKPILEMPKSVML